MAALVSSGGRSAPLLRSCKGQLKEALKPLRVLRVNCRTSPTSPHYEFGGQEFEFLWYDSKRLASHIYSR